MGPRIWARRPQVAYVADRQEDDDFLQEEELDGVIDLSTASAAAFVVVPSSPSVLSPTKSDDVLADLTAVALDDFSVADELECFVISPEGRRLGYRFLAPVARRQNCRRQDDARLTTLGLPPENELCSELDDGGLGACMQRYAFHVSLGDRIPLETVAAPVKISRLKAGLEWRRFLHRSVIGSLNDDGIPLDRVLECPCCLGILRRPVSLPCGHSLCRSCLGRLPVAGLSERYCPLCRRTVPRNPLLNVNENLDAVCEALYVFKAMAEKERGSQPGVIAH